MVIQPKHGDVIKVSHIFYDHYGIYAEGGTVIHYTDAKGSDFKGKVQETSLEKFLNGEKSYSIVKFADSCHLYSPEDTVKRARSKIDTENYNLVFNNCEHFAVWCKTGRARSSQVQKAVRNISIFVAAAIAFIGFNHKNRA